MPLHPGYRNVRRAGPQLESGHYLPIIERNCTVPVSREKSIVTVHDGQTEVVVRIFQARTAW